MSEMEVERILSYFDKIKNLEILFCTDHDREFPSDEGCPICEEDKRLFLEEMKWREEEQRI